MVSVCLHTHMYSDYFMEICDYIDIRLSRSFLKVTFDSFSSSAPSIMMPGRHRKRGGGTPGLRLQPQSSMAPGTHSTQVSHTRSPSLLRLNLLLIPKVSILLEQMKFCFSQNTFFLILYLPRNKLDGPTSRPADLRSRSCKE